MGSHINIYMWVGVIFNGLFDEYKNNQKTQ